MQIVITIVAVAGCCCLNGWQMLVVTKAKHSVKRGGGRAVRGCCSRSYIYVKLAVAMVITVGAVREATGLVRLTIIV